MAAGVRDDGDQAQPGEHLVGLVGVTADAVPVQPLRAADGDLLAAVLMVAGHQHQDERHRPE